MTKLALTINGRAHGPVEVRDELTMNDFLGEFLGLTTQNSAAAPRSA